MLISQLPFEKSLDNNLFFRIVDSCKCEMHINPLSPVSLCTWHLHSAKRIEKIVMQKKMKHRTVGAQTSDCTKVWDHWIVVVLREKIGHFFLHQIYASANILSWRLQHVHTEITAWIIEYGWVMLWKWVAAKGGLKKSSIPKTRLSKTASRGVTRDFLSPHFIFLTKLRMPWKHK